MEKALLQPIVPCSLQRVAITIAALQMRDPSLLFLRKFMDEKIVGSR
jgi:hypothetical protein